MQVHIFRGPDRIFGFTAHSDGTNLPSQYAPWTAFKTIELTRGTTQAGVNVTECLDDIEKHGFHLTDVHVRTTERAVTQTKARSPVRVKMRNTHPEQDVFRSTPESGLKSDSAP